VRRDRFGGFEVRACPAAGPQHLRAMVGRDRSLGVTARELEVAQVEPRVRAREQRDRTGRMVKAGEVVAVRVGRERGGQAENRIKTAGATGERRAVSGSRVAILPSVPKP
jgi:hypothetical protein